MKKWMFLLAALAACDATVSEVPGTSPDEWTTLTPQDHGSTTILPNTGEGREARRMSIDQLRRSIPVLFDGITWTLVNRTGDEEVGFDLLSATLGEADYIRTTQNNEEPSPLFAKFMDDMASDVCTKAIRRDDLGGAPKLVIVDDDIDVTLRFLRMKLHGIYVPPDSTEGIASLRALYDDVAATESREVAHLAVCMAMLTAPELMAY